MIQYTLPPGLEMIDYKLPERLIKKDFPDESGFWYWYKDKSILSVSRILNRIYPLPAIAPFYLTRGKYVHSASVLIDAGNLDWEALDPRLVPYCKAYQTFIEMSHPIIEASELIVVATDYSYGGRLDRVFRLPGRERLLVTDLKVGAGKEERYWLQIAAYALVYAGEHVADLDLAILNLQKNGMPRLTVAPDPGEKVAEWKKILADYLEGANA